MMDSSTLDLAARLIELSGVIGSVAFVVYRLGKAVQKFESLGELQTTEINKLNQEVSALGELVTKMALASQRQDMIERRIDRQEKILDDLRRGEGYILPLIPKPASR